jgi:hypothetical protein
VDSGLGPTSFRSPAETGAPPGVAHWQRAALEQRGVQGGPVTGSWDVAARPVGPDVARSGARRTTVTGPTPSCCQYQAARWGLPGMCT